ncbi:MAG: helix-turn-helix transcriptional regulator [Armatimonadetes bacterium]|nr:helix-turn-helix transcriptional regulator [Armatimonadota bacterium]
MAARNQKQSTQNKYCPVVATMNLLNQKWALHVLRELMGGSRRFNELLHALGEISPRTLCGRLRALEEEGIVLRSIKHHIPPWVEYDLTEKGRALNAVIDSIAVWGRVYMADTHCREGRQPREGDE